MGPVTTPAPQYFCKLTKQAGTAPRSHAVCCSTCCCNGMLVAMSVLIDLVTDELIKQAGLRRGMTAGFTVCTQPIVT